MPEIRKAVVTAEAAGTRLDAYLATAFDLSRNAAERLLGEGRIEIAGGEANKKYRLKGGEEITLTLPDPVPAEAEPEDIPLDVVFEDEDIIVINKPQGMVVHPAAGNERGTLVNALLHHCKGSLSGVGGVERPGIVHRIDKDTSGLLVVAKNDFSHTFLSDLLKTHDIRRVYVAITVGGLREERGTVNAPIGRHPTDRKKMAICRREGEGREAITHYEVLERFHGYTLVQCRLETGRTHQIRVHMASLSHPLLGDPVYGGNGSRFEANHRKYFHGQCLHARELSLTHPRTGEQMTFKAPLPEDFEKILTLLRNDCT